MNEAEIFEEISKKLSVLIALNLIASDGGATMTENVEILSRLRLSDKEISEILNTSKESVGVMKRRSRKNKGKIEHMHGKTSNLR